MAKNSKKNKAVDCFVIMPISDQAGYPQGHFTSVFEDIICKACDIADVNPVRGDSTRETNIIHVDIVRKLISSDLAICDVSSRNPNVMFELGIRQAYGLPTVLISDTATPRIFDVNPIRCVFYDASLEYRSVLQAQQEIANAIQETRKSKDACASSIVTLAHIQPATRPESSDPDFLSMLKDEILNKLANIEDRILNLESTRGASTSPQVPGLGIGGCKGWSYRA